MGALRILLAISVFLFHTGTSGFFRVMDGGAAVFCFFVISGFYMELVLTEKYTKLRLGSEYLKRFYLSRFWRLYPIYFIILSVTLVLTVLLSQVQLPEIFHGRSELSFASSARLVIVYMSNFTMFFLNLPSTKDLLIGPGWSIGVEISFYVLAPFILRMPAINLIVLSIIGLSLQFIPYGQHSPILFGVHFFIAGALSRRYHCQIESVISKFWKPKLNLIYAMVVFMVFFAIPHEIYIGVADEHTHNSIDRLIYPLFVAILIPILHELSSKSRFDYWVGQLSYPFYLVHALVISVFINWVHPLKVIALLLICIFISSLLVLLEVRMIEPWRKRLSKLD
jgi:peptidoglycan/LPS O-acetylase OafA/YrhL